MKFNRVLIASLLFAGSLFSQMPDVQLSLQIKDDRFTAGQKLNFGLGTAASDTIDAAYGEGELPPVPPTGVFDARFVGSNISLAKMGNGLLSDYRQGSSSFRGSRIHQVQWQNSAGATQIVVSTTLPPGVSITFEDFFGGAVVTKTVSGTDSVVVTNLAITTLKMTVTYDLSAVPPPTIPVLSAPADGAVVNSFQPSLTWLTVSDATEYQVQLANDSLFAQIVKDTVKSVTTVSVGPLTNNAAYFWRVRSKNSGGFSAYAPVRKFTIRVSVGDTAVGLVLKIKDNLQNKATLLAFGLHPSATDNIDTALGEAELPPSPPTGVFDARFVGTNIAMPQLGNGLVEDYRQGSSALAGTKIHQVQWQYSSGASQTVLSLDLPPGVSAKCEDFFGGAIINKTMVGNDSLVVTNTAMTTIKMTVTYHMGGIVPPATPVLLTPVHGAVITAYQVSLTWEAVNGATAYRVQLAKDSLFLQMVRDTLETTTKISTGTLVHNTTYFWRVRAENAGVAGEYAAPWKFSINVKNIDWANLQWPGTITMAPTDSAEVYGQVWIDGVTSQPGPTPGLEAWFVFTNDTTKLNPDVWAGAIPARFNAFASTTNNDEFTVKFAMPSGNYFYLFKYKYNGTVKYGGWENAFYDSTKKNVGRMTIAYLQPAVPELVSPKNGDVVKTKQSTLLWKSSLFAARYRCQLSRDTSFVALLADTTVADTMFVATNLADTMQYYWRVQALNGTLSSAFSPFAAFRTDILLGVKEQTPFTPQGFTLLQNYPNPFNPSTTIAFTIPKNEYVRLAVYDVLGRSVAVLVDGFFQSGGYAVRFDASNLASGLYIYELRAGSIIEKRKMQLMK